MDLQSLCSNCKGNTSPTDFFCPHCGKKLREESLSTTFAKQIWLYFLSFFFPPFGIWPAIKYLRQEDEKSKKIGIALLFITIISIVITLWFTLGFVNSFNKEFNSQMKLYQGTGL